jgi:ADP-ribose pyrophosphatase YjhB (NUDIX family)
MRKYSPLSAAATVVVILPSQTDTTVLTGTRSLKSDAYPGCVSLPGGFLEVGKETLEQCAVRELREETSLVVQESDLVLFGIVSGPETDPRTHMINACYYTVITESMADTVKAGDDLTGGGDNLLRWVGSMAFTRDFSMAFNHLDIARAGLLAWREASNG